MMQLCREIRFALVNQYQPKITNSWSGWPATNLIAPQLRLLCVVEGVADSRTGYICNIKNIDDLLRSTITDEIIPKIDSRTTAETLLRQIFEFSQTNWNPEIPIVRQTLCLSNTLSYSIDSKDSSKMELTQQFEFSASHRLHCEELSDDENRNLFGKCNNPAGHGHNYVVEISVSGDVNSSGQLIELHEFESKVKELIIDRLDHKHLNLDVDYFAKVNPSVENITTAIWNWLEGQFGSVKLSKVKVYETPKTWAQLCG